MMRSRILLRREFLILFEPVGQQRLVNTDSAMRRVVIFKAKGSNILDASAPLFGVR
jgi:hypothetical protein